MDNETYLKYYTENVEKNNKVFGDRDIVYSVRGMMSWLKKSYTRCLFINPGPTLDDKMSDLERFSADENTAIFCSDICARGLIEKGIRIDYVVTLDPNPIVSHYFAGLDDHAFDVVCSSASPIHLYFNPNRNYYIYNAVDETKEQRFHIMPEESEDEVTKEQYDKALAKSKAMDSSLKGAGVYSRFHPLLNKGTVGVTLYQLACLAKLESIFLGSDYTVRRDKPYAEFISKPNYKYLSKHVESMKKMSYKEYLFKILNNFFFGQYDAKEVFGTTQHSSVAAPKLELYRKLMISYATHVDVFPKDVKIEFR